MVATTPAMLPAAAWQVRFHYRPKCEAAGSSRAALERHASLQCLARACSLHPNQDMALQHFSRFFLLRSREHSEAAHSEAAHSEAAHSEAAHSEAAHSEADESLKFLQNQRGGCVPFLDIRMSDSREWEHSLQAMQDALLLEKSVSHGLLDLHQLATESSDARLCRFLETRHLDQQLEFIKELGDHLTSVRKMGAPEGGLAEYAFDKLTLGAGDKD